MLLLCRAPPSRLLFLVAYCARLRATVNRRSRHFTRRRVVSTDVCLGSAELCMRASVSDVPKNTYRVIALQDADGFARGATSAIERAFSNMSVAFRRSIRASILASRLVARSTDIASAVESREYPCSALRNTERQGIIVEDIAADCSSKRLRGNGPCNRRCSRNFPCAFYGVRERCLSKCVVFSSCFAIFIRPTESKLSPR